MPIEICLNLNYISYYTQYNFKFIKHNKQVVYTSTIKFIIKLSKPTCSAIWKYYIYYYYLTNYTPVPFRPCRHLRTLKLTDIEASTGTLYYIILVWPQIQLQINKLNLESVIDKLTFIVFSS